MAGMNAQCCHFDLIVLDDGHMRYLGLVLISFPEGFAVSLVDLDDDRENSRADALEQVAVPLFKSLGHNGMVGICKGICYDMPSLFPRISAVIEQRTHKLGDSKCGVGIVDMDSYLFVQVIKRAVDCHMLIYDIADRCCAKEILLTQTQRLALCVIIVWIQHLCDSL